MSVKKLTLDRREGRDAVGAKQSYVWKFTAETESSADDENVVLSHDELPAKYSTHPSDRRALVKSRNAAQRAPTVWDVTVNFDTEPISQADKNRDEKENPLERPVEISWSTIQQIDVVEEDRDGDPIQTKAKERFDPGAERPYRIIVLTLVKNQAEYSASTPLEYCDTVSSGTFYGASAGKPKMDDISAQRMVEGDYTYWKVTYVVHFKVKTWVLRLLHQGFKEIRTVGGVTKPRNALDADGRDSASQVLLAADGTRLAEDADPVFLEFDVLEEKDWSSLGLEET